MFILSCVSVIYVIMWMCKCKLCEFMCMCKCELCETMNLNCVTCRAQAGPGSFMGLAFRASPARVGLCSAVLGQHREPVGRPGPARLLVRAQTGSGWAEPCPFGHLYILPVVKM
jgi:hypothetical protein